ncbi:MAG: type II toxin-antitoxin system VapC family toxin [Candidatus Omnitrophota bacterium]|jgi:tRNA(fMet)-specific endonuclease VapC|nr:MAG: type II toxin-antitoxin system VapC family toxin [Candidatus Omnitrophota bacterium]
MYLIDTDTIIYVLNNHEHVIHNFRKKGTFPKAISVVTYGELYYGAMKSKRQYENPAKVRRLSELFPVIDVTRAIMEVFGSLKEELIRKGNTIDDFDVIIASTALMMNYRLVTNNEKHFRKIPGLKIENWTRRNENA